MKGFILIIFLSFIFACSDPCLDLANRICDCESTSDRRNNCKNIFIRNNSVSISENEEKRCEELLNTCSCAKLNDGDFAACGLSKTPLTDK